MMKKQEKQNQLAREILTLSRDTLLVNLRFLDVALSQFQWLPIESGTLLTNGKHILYNPQYVLACYKRAKEIISRDYLHMVLHCVFQHMYIGSALNRPYWDLACDITVEHIITELGLQAVSTPRERQQAKIIAAIKQNLKYITAEKVYVHLRQAVPNPEEIAEMQNLFYADDHKIWYMNNDEVAATFGLSNSGSDSNSDDNGTGSNDNRAGANNSNANNSNANNSNDSSDINNRAAMAAVWQDISQRMQVELEAFGKQKGLNPGVITQNLAAVNREKYDYTAFLKKFAVMGEAMRVNDDEFDYIFYTYGLQLYKNMPLIEPLEYKEIKAIKEFIIVIDTSGSTSGELVQKFVQKTFNILKSTESFFTKINLHIIQCDADIQEDTKITSQEEFDEYLKTMQIRGFGGTDFRPVFEYVDRLRQEREFINLRGLIYFTDGHGTFPANKPDYETAFVFVGDEYNNPDVPSWAIKLILQENEI